MRAFLKVMLPCGIDVTSIWRRVTLKFSLKTCTWDGSLVTVAPVETVGDSNYKNNY